MRSEFVMFGAIVSHVNEEHQEVTNFLVVQFVLLTYPKKPPNKLSALFRGSPKASSFTLTYRSVTI